MTIAPGTRLGSYEVVAPIGAGGMGEVYQAHDTKLGRDVAIKVLPEAFAHDAERLARFQREAKMLAALNHPNIATIHGLEQSGGTSYLVMELVSGETLQERVRRDGPVPVGEALKISAQIAEALEAAHEKQIIHRDLKPANVKVTPEGKVKVLDFGLAKAFEGDLANQDMNNSPTLSQAATMQGVILGTAGYMSPEQARGKATDKRTDIWAFGCVLYELLTGKQAFQGETVTDITVKILTGEPEWTGLPPETPTQIRILLKRCLQKEKTLRKQAAGDVRIEIQEALSGPAPAESAEVAGKELHGWRLPVLIGLTALITAVVVEIVAWNVKPARPQPVTRAVINLPPGQQLAGMNSGPALALSPDGTQLAYVAREGGVQQIYIHAMDSLEAKPLTGTEGAVIPFFSPDAQWVGFFAGAKLKKISVSGGLAQTLGDAGIPLGASWGNHGMIALATAFNSVLVQASEAGGALQPLTQFSKQEITHRWPEFLPGGKAVLFTAGENALNFTNAQIAVQPIGKGERRDLIQGGMNPRYAPSGHLVYAQGDGLMAVPFDMQRLVTTGGAVPVVKGVLQSPITGSAQYSLSATGSLAYVPGHTQSVESKLVLVTRDGKEQPLVAPVRAYVNPRMSPDGRKLAITIEDQEDQIWLYDLSRDTLTRLTFEGMLNNPAVWTPDGKRIAFASNKDGPTNIFWELADGSGGMERLTTSDHTQLPRSFSPDGQLLAFMEVNQTTGYDISVLQMGNSSKGSGQSRGLLPFLRTSFNESVPAFSPDGHWLAYVSDESGRFEVYAQPYPGPGGKYQISTEGGTEPTWNPSGKELFYRSGAKMMAVDIVTQPTFSIGKPRVLFEGPYLPTRLTFPNYDVAPDGQRFLMLKPVEQAETAPTQINIVLNWFEELKRRVPTGTK